VVLRVPRPSAKPPAPKLATTSTTAIVRPTSRPTTGEPNRFAERG
jgi:hypothetical protein